MREQGSGIRGRRGPIAWGGLALLALVALASSVFLSTAAIGASERDAADRAEDLSASIVASELTPELVLRDITDEDYRTLLVAVQAGILSDDQVVSVRVWRTDGNLIFSTAQRDEPAEVLAPDDPQIQAAAGGEVVSVLSTEIEPRVGLRRANEELLQTYVPVSLVSESLVDAVVEIDQKYGAIRNDALTLWRPLQILLAVVLVAAVGSLVRSMTAGSGTREASDPSQPMMISRADDRVVREAKERVKAAERRAKEAEDRLKERDGGVTADGGALEELDLKLRAAEAEREQHTGELQRLRAALAETEADLALARDGNGNPRAEAKKANKLVAEADRRAGEAEQKVATAERKTAEATQRAVDASGRALEMEAQVRELEERLAQAATAVEASASTKRRDSGERKAASELKRSTDELTRTKAELGNAFVELESAKAELATKQAELGTAQGELDTSQTRIAQMQAERDEHRAKAAELELALAEARASAARVEPIERPTSAEEEVSVLEERARNAELRLVDSEERFADVRGRLSESDARLADALARLAELEQARSSGAGLEEAGSAGVGDADGTGRAEDLSSSGLAGRIAELEKARRGDIEGLNRAQESFANTQVELTNTTRKLKEAERRIHELEGDLGVPRQGVPTYVPSADRGSADGEVTVPAPQVDETIDLHSFEERVSSLRAGLAAASDLSWDLDPETTSEAQAESELSPMSPVPEKQPVSDPRHEPERALEPEGELESDPEEGLSLRERLARAAAARHRGPLA